MFSYLIFPEKVDISSKETLLGNTREGGIGYKEKF